MLCMFRAGNGTLSVTIASDGDGNISQIIQEIDPFAP